MGYSLLDVEPALSRVKQAYNELGMSDRANDHAHGNPDSLVNEVMDYGLSVNAIKERLKTEYNVTDPHSPVVPHISADDYAKRQQDSYELNRPKNVKLEFDLFSEFAPAYQDILDSMMEKSRKAAAEYEFELYDNYADKYADKMTQITKELYPEQHNLGEVLAGDLKNRLLSDTYDVPENIKSSYRNDIREAWSDRGLAYSGQSAAEEAHALADLSSDWRTTDIGTALTLDARLPKAAPLEFIPGNALAPKDNVPGFVPQVNDYFNSALNASLGKYSTDLSASLKQQSFDMELLQLKKINDAANENKYFENLFSDAVQDGVSAFAMQAGSGAGTSTASPSANPYGANSGLASYGGR